MRIPWERCRVTVYKPSKACDGYTLIDPLTSNDVWLIDMEGNYVHRWVMPGPPRNHGALLPSGNLLYAMAQPRPEDDPSLPRQWGISAGLLEVDWYGDLVWKYLDIYQHHSFSRLDNGNTLYCRAMRVPDEIAVRVRGGVPETEDRGMMFADGVNEVTPEGDLVWEWKAYEHLDPEVNAMCPLGPRDDWTHLNSCFELPDGDILLSFRNISTVCIIDKSTGNIKWQWGPGEIAHQHDATMLEDGNILLFDNGAHRQNGSLVTCSRVVEVNPATNKIEWEYKANPPWQFYSALISGCQRLPNGNTLICEAMKGRVFEVTMDGEIVWEFTNPFFAPHPFAIRAEYAYKATISFLKYTNSLFRAYRYLPDYPGLAGKDLDPGKLIWVNRLYGPEAFRD